ncbi:hypothetical protein DR190_08640 [Klebsiella pneumoniae]|nr:hypothetical protein DR191_08655 [Klebsiella pneumoniae]UUO77199.1 hypothetical protein DR190_08640 [Klebsiella pneumoniae]UUO82857.1 hypothetical protein DR189_08655 [Klebsiella pneumoniae]UUO88522.1 hypothetical protein DR188_08645 [Klebsiella pneumoniae]
MMSLWDALRMNMMISYQELVRTFPKHLELRTYYTIGPKPILFIDLFLRICHFNKIHNCGFTQKWRVRPVFTALRASIAVPIRFCE